MSVSPAPGPLFSRAEFELMQAAAPAGVRLERMDGYVYAMAGAGLTHERLVARLLVALDGPARGHGCEVLGSNRRLAVGADTDFLPDLAVYCDPDDDETAGTRPRLVVEVLSRSTALDDVNLKVPRYQTIESVEAILLVNPEPLYAELYRRSDGWARSHLTGTDDMIVLSCPPAHIRLGDLLT
jgi:Uma2 family endonuclease